MDHWDLAQSLRFHLGVVSLKNSHMGQLNQKEDFMVLLTVPTIKTMKNPFNTLWTPATWPTNIGKSSLSDARDPADVLGI